jgi:hypothetical protein
MAVIRECEFEIPRQNLHLTLFNALKQC